MVHALQHAVLPQPTPDEQSRQRFVLAFKRTLTSRVRAGNATLYERAIRPRFEAGHGREPRSWDEMIGALFADSRFLTWCTLQRASQEMMWQAVGETLVREEPRITAAAKQLRATLPAGGSVETGAVSAEALRAYEGHRIHLHPRGYLREASPDDVSAGAFYEMGGNLYSMGRGMGVNDSKAGALIAWLRKEGVAKAPRRILDLGCSAGASTAPYALAFPDAEVHGIDLGAAMVRYAHARAESLGARVHFHQMDATDLRFPDGHFDLVVSHNLLHEISDDTRRRMFREIARVLADGGTCILQDVAIRTGGRSLFETAERAWDVEFNDEPYWMEYADAPILEELQAAGFPAGAVREFPLSKIEGPGHWYAVVATRAAVAARAA